MPRTKIDAIVDYIPMAWNAIKIIHIEWNTFIVFLTPNQQYFQCISLSLYNM